MGSRRAFLRAAGRGALGAGLGLAAAGARAQRGAPRMRLAILGLGVRGTRLARLVLAVPGAEVVGVADLYQGRLARAHELLGEGVSGERDPRRLLDRGDVDAVLVATPDHTHARLAREALAAGKHVYCESPLTHSPVEAAPLRTAAARAGRVFASGGGAAGGALLAAAREQLPRLGRVTLVSGVSESGGALEAWQTPFPPDASPETVDFPAFLGDAPRRDFDLHRFFRWRRYWDYGTGLAGERFAPQLSLIQSLLGLGGPQRAQASGAVRLWQDGREVPDTFVATLDYAKGPGVLLSATQCGGRREELRFLGSQATLVLRPTEVELLPEPMTEPYPAVGESWPREYRNWFYMIHGLTPSGEVRGVPPAEKAAERWSVGPRDGVEAAHLADFLRAVRTEGRSAEGLEAGLEAATAVHMCNAAWRLGRPVGHEEVA